MRVQPYPQRASQGIQIQSIPPYRAETAMTPQHKPDANRTLIPTEGAQNGENVSHLSKDRSWLYTDAFCAEIRSLSCSRTSSAGQIPVCTHEELPMWPGSCLGQLLLPTCTERIRTHSFLWNIDIETSLSLTVCKLAPKPARPLGRVQISVPILSQLIRIKDKNAANQQHSAAAAAHAAAYKNRETLIERCKALSEQVHVNRFILMITLPRATIHRKETDRQLPYVFHVVILSVHTASSRILVRMSSNLAGLFSICQCPRNAPVLALDLLILDAHIWINKQPLIDISLLRLGTYDIN